MFMGAQEVIVSYPEGKVIVGTVDAVESVCVSVRSFISTVQPFDHLLKRTVLCRYSVVVGKSNDLSDGKSKIFSILFGEFHCSKRVGAVAIRNELKVFRQFCESAESHAHGEDTRTNAPVIGYLITENGSCGGIHDQPDIGFDPADLLYRSHQQ